MAGWIGVDLDGTLATYTIWEGSTTIGQPIAPMVDRVRGWLADGIEVRIFTARVCEGGRVDAAELDAVTKAIQEWCLLHIGLVLTVTCTKDFGMVELWDDRCRQVETNTGRLIEDKGDGDIDATV